MSPNPLARLGGHPIIGHRGAAGLAPENTVPSFDLALEQGADAFELDIHVSADGIPVVHHDPTLERTTDAAGPLAARTAADLGRIDAGARFSQDGVSYPFRGLGIGVPTLAAILDRYPVTPLLIELKVVAAASPVADLIRRSRAFDRCIIASFIHEAVTPFQQPPFLAGASRRGITRLWLRSNFGIPFVPDHFAAYAVPVRYKDRLPVPTRRFIAAAAELGAPVHVWTVDDPAMAAELRRRGVAGVVTNYPGRMKAALGAPGST